jgi:hypothetical protein
MSPPDTVPFGIRGTCFTLSWKSVGSAIPQFGLLRWINFTAFQKNFCGTIEAFGGAASQYFQEPTVYGGK